MLWVCHLCDKPFVKESSHKRHISYCRRTQTKSRTRPRSCLACNAAKVKCTFQTPCRRCSDKGLQCVYDTPKRAAVTVRETEVILDGADERRVDAVPAFDHGIVNTYGHFPPADAGNEDLSTLDLSLEDMLASAEVQSTIRDHQEGNNSMVFYTPADHQLQPGCSPTSLWAQSSIQPRMGSMEQAPWSSWTNAVTATSTLLTPELNRALSYSTGELVPTLQMIRSPSTVVQHSMRLIIQGLRAYPMMMLRRETLPPFIHPHWHRHTAPALPEPLSSCMSIAHMYAFRTQETKPFLWRTVQAEDERFLAQRGKMSPEDMLACIQAQMIYMIMRFVDGSQDPPELNQQLIRTYQVLCKLFRRTHNNRFCQLDDTFIARPTWEEWVFAESRRRTACVFFLICRCISVTTGIEGCDAFHEFKDLPLACPKTLWEARTRAEWEAEYAAYSASFETGMHTMGMLIDAHRRCAEDVAKSSLLDLWNARTDNLGELLNIVTSMV